METAFITRVTAVFFSYLVAALLTERFTEAAMASLKYAELKLHRPDWPAIGEKVRLRLERYYRLQTADRRGLAVVDGLLKTLITVPDAGDRRLLSVDLIRKYYYRLISYGLTFSAALILAFSLRYDLVAVITQAYPETARILAPRPYPAVNVLLSAVAISLGVQPLHQVISRIEKRLEKKRQAGGLQ